MGNELRARNGSVGRVLLYVLALNWGVALAKMALGAATGAVSITADGFHSLFDGASNVVGLAGMRYASKPKDYDHPYGHQKYETLVALAIVGMLVLTAYEIGESILRRLQSAETPDITLAAFAVMLATLCVNMFVTRYELARGRRLASPVLVADAAHTQSDVLVTLSVIAGMVAMRLGYALADALVALFVVAMILRTAYMIVKPLVSVLSDHAAASESRVKRIAKKVRGVVGVHGVRTRGSPDFVFMDLHLRVAPETPINEAHQISHRLKRRITREMPNVKDVVIHIEPSN